MNPEIIIIVIICFTCVNSWLMEEFLEEETRGVRSFFEEQKNQFENFVNTVDTSATLVRGSVQDYVKYQQKKITGDFNQYVDSVQEQQRKVSENFDKYIDTLKESGRKVTDTFAIFVDSNDTVSPDIFLTAPEIITRAGYICETHKVISEGYVLNLHRILKPKYGTEISKKTVLLQHGLLASSTDWILNGPEKSLAYLLAEEGYDVWMTNIRGNRYSRQHSYYSTDSEEFWDFSWHDVALHDVPNIIDYIMEHKGPGTKIVYMGHSMGTTILFAMLTLRPEYNNVLTAGYALAPEVFFTDFRSPIKSLTSITSNVAYMEKLYGSYEFVPKKSSLGKLTSMCSTDTLDFYVCRNALFYICGFNEKQFNKTILPVFLSHSGTGTSWKTVLHFSQLISSGKFQQFDYGRIENLMKYGSMDPPKYNLSKITLPITLFWSQNDLLSSEQDVKLLYSKLPSKTRKMYLVPDPEFNHLDYLWAIDIKKLLNDKIIEFLNAEFRPQKRLTFFNMFTVSSEIF